LFYASLLGLEFWGGFEIFGKFMDPDINNINLVENTLGLEYKLQLALLLKDNVDCLF
jgi:hypothetical protein